MTVETPEFQTVLLSPNEILKVWHLIEADIEKALDHGINEITILDMCKQALNNKIFIFITLDRDKKIVCTTTLRFLNYGSVKTCQIITNTTNGIPLKQVEHDHRVFEDFARDNGCSHMQVWGRKGWQRRLKSLSSRQDNRYETLYYVYNMEI
jgi:hypothetical protein